MTDLTSDDNAFAALVNTMHKEIVNHLLTTYVSSGDGAIKIGVMFAAALAVRSFMDARMAMLHDGKADKEQVGRELNMIFRILSEDVHPTPVTKH